MGLVETHTREETGDYILWSSEADCELNYDVIKSFKLKQGCESLTLIRRVSMSSRWM